MSYDEHEVNGLSPASASPTLTMTAVVYDAHTRTVLTRVQLLLERLADGEAVQVEWNAEGEVVAAVLRDIAAGLISA